MSGVLGPRPTPAGRLSWPKPVVNDLMLAEADSRRVECLAQPARLRGKPTGDAADSVASIPLYPQAEEDLTVRTGGPPRAHAR